MVFPHHLYIWNHSLIVVIYSMTYLVSNITVVVHHCPHPADALLTTPSPQQRVMLFAAVVQKHAQYAGARSIHVVVEDQTLRGQRAPQDRGP